MFIRRRAGLLVTGAGVAVLTLSSAAFACTQYYGNITVSDTSDDGTAWTASIDGSKGTHGYCVDGQKTTEQVPQVADLTGSFTVTVGPSTECPGVQNSLRDAPGANFGNASYEVRWLSRPPLSLDGGVPASCRVAATRGVVLDPDFQLKKGAGKTVVNVPDADVLGQALPVGDVNICVIPWQDGVAGSSPPDIALLVI